MTPGIILLQGKGCILPYTDSESLSLQLSQHCDFAVSIGGLYMF